MATKVYDTAFDISLSREQLPGIRSRYEYLRKTELYRGRRVRKAFQTADALKALKREAQTKAPLGDDLGLKLSISFPASAEEDGEARWREYGTLSSDYLEHWQRRGSPEP